MTALDDGVDAELLMMLTGVAGHTVVGRSVAGERFAVEGAWGRVC
jgi:hypothetical protein